MLKPTKHTNPKLSVLNVAGLLIKELKTTDVLPYDEALQSLVAKTEDNVKEVFSYALSFLFLLDKIEYIPNLDAVRLKTHEAK